MTSRVDIYPAGPFVDRAGVISPVETSRVVELGDSPVTPSGTLRLAYGKQITLSSDPTKATVWTLFASGGTHHPDPAPWNNTFGLQYNIASDGTAYNPLEPRWGVSFETDYEPIAGGSRLMEFHLTYNQPGGLLSGRPFTIAISRTDGGGVPDQVDVAINANTFALRDPTTLLELFNTTSDTVFRRGYWIHVPNDEWALYGMNATATVNVPIAKVDPELRVVLADNAAAKSQMMFGSATEGFWDNAIGSSVVISPPAYPNMLRFEPLGSGYSITVQAPTAANVGSWYLIANKSLSFSLEMKHAGPGTPTFDTLQPGQWAWYASRIGSWNRVAHGGPIVEHQSFTVAQLLAGTPPATPAGRQSWCSDHAGGARLAYSDGAAWRDVRTGLVVA